MATDDKALTIARLLMGLPPLGAAPTHPSNAFATLMGLGETPQYPMGAVLGLPFEPMQPNTAPTILDAHNNRASRWPQFPSSDNVEDRRFDPPPQSDMNAIFRKYMPEAPPLSQQNTVSIAPPAEEETPESYFPAPTKYNASVDDAYRQGQFDKILRGLMGGK